MRGGRIPTDDHGFDASLEEMELVTAPASMRGTAGDLNRRLTRALRSAVPGVPTAEELDRKPFALHCKAPIYRSFNCYVYEVTTTDSERQDGAHRIQLTNGVPVRDRPGRLQFDRSNGLTPLLVGIALDWDVVVLWDADLHDFGGGFPFSKGVQVHERTILAALSRPFAVQERRLRPGGTTVVETVIAVRTSHLVPAMLERLRLSTRALLET